MLKFVIIHRFKQRMFKRLIYIVGIFILNLGQAQYSYQSATFFKKDSAYIAKSICLAPDGDIILTGVTGKYNHHTWIKRLNDSGRSVVTVYFNLHPEVIPESIVANPDGSVTLVGYNRAHGKTHTNIWLAKFNKQGRLLWERSYNGFGDSFGVKLAKTGDKGYVIAANYAQNPDYGYDWILLKVDSLGFIQWYKTQGTAYDDRVNDIAVLKNGFIVLAGYYRYNKGADKIAAVSIYDSNGNEVFFNNFKYLGWSEITALAASADTGFVAAGFFKNINRQNNTFLLKLNSYGDSLWFASIDMPFRNIPFSIIQAFDSSYVVAFTVWKHGFPYTDIGVAQFSKKGKLTFIRLLKRQSDDFVAQLVETRDNGLYLLASMYLLQKGWIVSLIKCETTRKSDLFFLRPDKPFIVFYTDKLLFKVCIKGYLSPQKVEILRNGQPLDTITKFSVTGDNKCPYYFEMFLPLKYGYNNFTFRVTDYKGYVFERKRKVLYVPLPGRHW